MSRGSLASAPLQFVANFSWTFASCEPTWWTSRLVIISCEQKKKINYSNHVRTTYADDSLWIQPKQPKQSAIVLVYLFYRSLFGDPLCAARCWSRLHSCDLLILQPEVQPEDSNVRRKTCGGNLDRHNRYNLIVHNLWVISKPLKIHLQFVTYESPSMAHVLTLTKLSRWSKDLQVTNHQLIESFDCPLLIQKSWSTSIFWFVGCFIGFGKSIQIDGEFSIGYRILA